MNSLKSTGLRTLIVFTLLLSSIAVVKIYRGTPAFAHGNGTNCGNVTDQQIITYMNQHGYTVYSISPISGSCDKRCDTQNCYDTKVHIENGAIIGHEDLSSDMCMKGNDKEAAVLLG